MLGLLPTAATVVRWVAPSGRLLPLHGPGADDVWLGEGVDGLGRIDVESLFEAAAREHGETWVGYRMDHGEIDLPVHVTASDPSALRRRCDHVEAMFERFRPGWLVTYSTVRGWRFVQARRKSLDLVTDLDPHRSRHAAYELTLLVEAPLAREADQVSEWSNTSRSGRGQIHLYPGSGEWTSWAQFAVRGPGAVRLRWAGNDLTLPRLVAGEWALVNSDSARPTIVARGADGRDRNLWPLLPPGQRIPYPLPAREVTRVDLSVVSGSSETLVRGRTRVYREGLV